MIYLDNGATTKPLKEALEFANKFNEEEFFNPSALYLGAVKNRSIIDDARNEILKSFGLEYDLFFTASGTEADNTAIFSCAKRGNVITTLGEHSAVYNCFEQLKNNGLDVRYAKLSSGGGVDVEHLLSLVDDKTTFVSVMHVNNETGAINDINEISRLIKEKNSKVIFHSDGVQAFMKIPYRIKDTVDLYSVSGHKIGGVKGVGALVKKRSVFINPYIIGGGQENGFRSGTENVYGIASFYKAYQIRVKGLMSACEKAKQLKEKFISLLDKNIFEIICPENSSSFIISVSAKGLRGEVIQHEMEDFDIIIGTGSACSSKKRTSRVLSSMGYGEDVTSGALRISMCFETTEEEIVECAEKLNLCAKKLKKVMDNV